jgi:predicted short-subunit dehydrogenase-like oxidoreductase (DUF2520 family)
MNLSIIGTGNMAWHLAKVFEKQGFNISEIYGRDLSKANNLALSVYDSKIVDDLDFSESTADVFFLCVSDDAIEDICSRILLPAGAIIVHTSGAKSLAILTETLKVYHDVEVNSGVFYPLMTFTKGLDVDFSQVPICIEAENPATEKVLLEIAKAISNDIYLINSEERAVLHVSAVFACNFTNHLWALSKEILESEDLDFDMLKPIITETLRKALKAKHPADVQTGPAIRADEATLNTHLEFLNDDPDLTKVYKTLSESIKDWHQK